MLNSGAFSLFSCILQSSLSSDNKASGKQLDWGTGEYSCRRRSKSLRLHFINQLSEQLDKLLNPWRMPGRWRSRHQQWRAPGAGSTSDHPRTILSMALAVTLISIPSVTYIYTYIHINISQSTHDAPFPRTPSRLIASRLMQRSCLCFSWSIEVNAVPGTTTKQLLVEVSSLSSDVRTALQALVHRLCQRSS